MLKEVYQVVIDRGGKITLTRCTTYEDLLKYLFLQEVANTYPKITITKEIIDVD